jgi:hypothetical protein
MVSEKVSSKTREMKLTSEEEEANQETNVITYLNCSAIHRAI